MQQNSTIDRRTFTLEALLAMLAGVAITVTGCGGDSGTSPSGGSGTTPGPGDKSGAITANHGHSAVITAAQLSAAGAVSLSIRGSADHTHQVDASAAEIVMIAAGQRIAYMSSDSSGAGIGDHHHTVTFN